MTEAKSDFAVALLSFLLHLMCYCNPSIEQSISKQNQVTPLSQVPLHYLYLLRFFLLLVSHFTKFDFNAIL